MFTVKVDQISTKAANYFYLTEEDKMSQQDCVEKLATAISNGEMWRIESAARDLISNGERNRRIDKHEEIIKGIMRDICVEVPSGMAITVASVAETYRKTGVYCKRECHGYGDTFIAPYGAASVAIDRLVETGDLIPSIGRSDRGSIIKCYYRK